jgi:hypothetical protein
MTKEHHIETVADMLKLSPEEFKRMIPDLMLWYAMAHATEGRDMTHTGFRWTDDGKNGITGIVATITKDGVPTGEVQEWRL